eukprot:763916-Hanusia_phi.AAC.3
MEQGDALDDDAQELVGERHVPPNVSPAPPEAVVTPVLGDLLGESHSQPIAGSLTIVVLAVVEGQKLELNREQQC